MRKKKSPQEFILFTLSFLRKFTSPDHSGQIRPVPKWLTEPYLACIWLILWGRTFNSNLKSASPALASKCSFLKFFFFKDVLGFRVLGCTKVSGRLARGLVLGFLPFFPHCCVKSSFFLIHLGWDSWRVQEKDFRISWLALGNSKLLNSKVKCLMSFVLVSLSSGGGGELRSGRVSGADCIKGKIEWNYFIKMHLLILFI